MTQLTKAIRVVARQARRFLALHQLRKFEVTGRAPSAVLAGLRTAIVGRASRDEKAEIERIEMLRWLLLSSSQEFELRDFGAGVANVFDHKPHESSTTVTRTIGQMTTYSKSPRGAFLLFRIIREFKPINCLEMGTCVGMSAAYEGVGLRMNGHGKLITLEGSGFLAARSARTVEELELSDIVEVRPGNFAETLAQAVTDLTPIDWAFVDGNHRKQATLDYTEVLLAALGREAILLYDDINWSEGMREAWDQIYQDPRFAMTVDLGSIGLAVVSESSFQRKTLILSHLY